MSNISEEIHLNIGAIIFPLLDRTDFTAPFEVLSRLPNSTFHILWKEKMPVKKVMPRLDFNQLSVAFFVQIGITKNIFKEN